MLNTIISLAILGFGLNYYFKYQNLKKQIQYWIDNPTEKTIEIIELYY